MTPREEFEKELRELLAYAYYCKKRFLAEELDEESLINFIKKWSPKDIEDEMQKAVQEIHHNHHKIIDDWCKAYLAQLYQEGIEIKPGCITLVEQEDFVLENGKKAKKYWFENPQKHDTCSKYDGTCDVFVVLCHSLNCHSQPIGVFYTEEKALERIQYLKKSCPEVFADAGFSTVRTRMVK